MPKSTFQPKLPLGTLFRDKPRTHHFFDPLPTRWVAGWPDARTQKCLFWVGAKIEFRTDVSKSAHICAADQTIPSFAAYQFSARLLQNWPKLRGNDFPILRILTKPLTQSSWISDFSVGNGSKKC